MKWFVLVFFFFLISSSGMGQKYLTSDIIRKADSIMISLVGFNAFENHYILDSAKEEKPGHISWEKDNNIKEIKLVKKYTRRFKFISIHYIFYLNKGERPFYDSYIILNKNLNLQVPVDTSFIPKYVLRGTKPGFMTQAEVLKIAKTKFMMQGIKPWETSLDYDHSRGFYVWTVRNILSEDIDYYGHPWKVLEYLELDATTGEILNYYPKIGQGAVY